MFKNKRGFTLIEFLAVIVVLAIIILIATNVILNKVERAKRNSTEVNANNYVKAVNGIASLSQNEGEDMEEGTFNVSDLNSGKVNISGEKPKAGYVVISNYEVVTGCLEYEKYRAIIKNGKTTSVDLNKCGTLNEVFAYSGHEKTFKASMDGWYKLEVWGAQGGSYNATHSGGFGGYSVGYVYLDANQTLYVNVGGKGEDGTSPGQWEGGYNGGGNGKKTPRNDCANSGGGGATSIATKTGLLSDLSSASDKSKILIVAGGGGGAGYYNDGDFGLGGSGGGTSGVIGEHTSQSGRKGNPGTQTTGFSIGKGEDGSTKGDGGAGGGGGYYGGYASSTNGGGGGGSGYIASSELFEKEMFCYNCTPDTNIKTKTTTTNCAESDPRPQCAKKDDGYAKISYIGDDFESSYNNFEFDYTNGQKRVVIAKTGTYKLEVWGAQGGSVSGNAGGYGGYSVGEINLSKGQKLYINVGGQGTGSSSTAVDGGYNGGGNGHGGMCGQYKNRNGSSGGGATSIALVSGQLPSLEKYKGTLKNNNTPDNANDDYYESNKILIVAGGGGGGFNIDNWLVGAGGSSGGKTGYRGTHNNNGQTTDYATGGTQTQPGRAGDGYTNVSSRTESFFKVVNASFGKGGNTTTWDCLEGGGGGGGFYGGGSGSETSGAGGSGYIANPSLTNKKMVMYSTSNDYVSDAVQTKTEVTTSVSSTAESNKAKTGNGYAKITLIN